VPKPNKPTPICFMTIDPDRRVKNVKA